MNPLRKYLSREDLLQEACISYLKLMHGEWLFAHVPNEGGKTPFERLKTSINGTLKGFSDIIIIEQEANFFGLVVELKVKDNKCTSEQVDFLIKMSERGFAAAVVYDDVQSFIECIDDWLSGRFDPYTITLYKKETEKIKLDKAMEALSPKPSPHLRGIKRGRVKDGKLFSEALLMKTK